jgi:hypothetical protein
VSLELWAQQVIDGRGLRERAADHG